MPNAPTTVTQVAIVLLLVLPGVTYQFVRERARGLAPHHKDLGERILRAVTAGVVLDTFYVLLAGPWVVRLIYDRHRGWLTGTADHPRLAALTAILLLIVLPAGTASLVSRLSSPGRGSTYDATPTAWDSAFIHRSHCFVRARLKSGRWVGGWYGERSYASSYPEAADLYLQTAWAVSPAGRFEHPLEQSGGIYIRMDDVECMDFVDDILSVPGDGDATND
ncbi:hypothetical protein GTW98_13000 [Streptomyces sp. SID8375]|uniref:Uncharacterized protein n=1 Tax=Streptomyces lydicus TaxID=47763 RepID=A0A3Q9KD93_9ACTN|nr:MULTISPECIES: DUF6338 family protein [Streptomyces]AZS74838.1 hypothetical protein DDE74_31375 [Streptomyces lydicus]MYX07712.1 hypothetical protein [Streptomyces sp. SID8375]